LVALSNIAGQMQSASASIERIFELLEIKSPVSENINTEKFIESKYFNIKFINVDFSYPSRKDLEILKKFNLKINHGQKIAIMGSSGSGKSTILQLLLRFYDVKNGEIYLNSHNIKNLSIADLRKNFAYISQDCFIFSGTIFDNISYANENLTPEMLEKIISENSALDFIRKMPEGIHSFVGEKGIKLSGGERQRIAFARAIAKNSPILLFDEATSALDIENEKHINQAIFENVNDKTVIIVAHKISSIINCDNIIFIKDGEIFEEGNHQELIKMNGYYKKLYDEEILIKK
jgi:ABC-type multidrug transport system fused ATPase/permease subunit